MLGTGATYLAFVTGNITNLKLPCALNAKENAHVKNGTEEDEVISTIAVASSAIVTTVILAVGVVAMSPLLSSRLFPPFSERSEQAISQSTGVFQ